MFNRSLYIVIISLVTVVAVGIGITMHLLNFLLPFNLDFAGENVFGYEVINEDVNKLDIDLSLGEISIVGGNELSVEYDMPEKLVPNIDVKNGTLVVSTPSVNFNFGNNMNYKGHVTVTVPCKVAEIDADASLGDVDISNIECEKFDASIALGDMDVSSIKCKNMYINNDMGDVTVEDSSCEKFDFKLAMGSAYLKNISFDDGDIDLSMGDANIDGTFKALDADCSMGDINIKNTLDDKDVDYDLDTSMGDITVNGDHWR